jgi:SAM-dependent methyltransferase
VHPFGAGIFDVVLSSFGVMFFDDPAAAFGNLRKALRRGGRLAFLFWRTRAETPSLPSGSPGPRRYSAAASHPGRRLPSPSPTPAGWARY